MPSAGEASARHPRKRVERVCQDRGESAVVDGCIDLLRGSTDVDGALVYALGGPPARWAVSDGASGPDYWLRVWAARGLLYVWEDRAQPAIGDAMEDPAWRVREMAAKVAARHRLVELLPLLQVLRNDSRSRVAASAERAVDRIEASPA